MNAVIYARYSSDNQREESIEGQIREISTYAERNGLTIVDTYIDRAMSAKTDNRPAFQQLIKDSFHGDFEAVIVWKLDRFSRSREDSGKYKAILRKNGVKVISATEIIAEDASGILLESVLEGYAEYYSDELSEKVKRGMKENALKCKFNGGTVPMGYTVDAEKQFHVEPVAAKIIVDAYQKYADGYTMQELCDHFKAIGFKSNRGKEISLETAKLILTNRKYIGEYKYGDVLIEDGMPTIVSLELFERAQRRLALNKKAPGRYKAKKDLYLLTTKLFCGKCGVYMVGESGTSQNGTFHQYYKCASVKNHKGCDKKTVRKAYIEDLVLNEVNKILADDEFIIKLVDIIFERQSLENVVIPQLKKQIAETTKAINNYLKAIEQGAFSISIKERLESLEKTRTELSIELAHEEIQRPVLTKDQIMFFLDKFRGLVISNTEHRQLLVDNFVNSVYLYDDKIIFNFNYGEEKKTVSLEKIKSSELSKLGEPRKPK